jgi:transposase
VSVKETSVCIVDDAGKIVQEVRVASEPEALLQVLTTTIYRFKRVGLEAGPLSQWLYSVLAEAGLPVICVETRHMRAMLKAQINKRDRNDARGLAQMMRVGLYRPVHVKTLRSQKVRVLLTHRKLLRALAVTTAMRAEALLDIPTFAEFVPGYEASFWYGVGAPKATPAEIVEKLNKEINAGLANPKIKAKLSELGGTVLPSSPADFGKLSLMKPTSGEADPGGQHQGRLTR